VPSGTPTLATLTEKPAATEAREPRTTPLRFELRGHPFPLPVVHGTVNGEPTWMLVDTGANSHVIASWLAHKVGLPMHPLGDVGSDHTGRAVMTYSVDHPDVVIDSWGALDDGPMLVTDVPEPIERLGIGAFISPQWLSADGEVVVMDLPGKEMHTAALADAVRSLGTRGKPLVTGKAHLCEDTASVIQGLGFVVPANVEGQAVELLVDTGAHKTDLLMTTRAGQRLLPRSAPSRDQMYAASGLVRTRTVRGVRVKVGEWSIGTDLDLIPGASDPVCPRDGVVSMDVLKSCVLVLGHKQLIGRCSGN
jgi:predicted aspartyl protease